MSVINNMLRDLDRRHAPTPLPNASAPIADRRRSWPRPALALAALAVIVGWNWEHRIAQPKTEAAVPDQQAVSKPSKTAAASGEVQPAARENPLPAETVSAAAMPDQIPGGSSPAAAASPNPNPMAEPVNSPRQPTQAIALEPAEAGSASAPVPAPIAAPVLPQTPLQSPPPLIKQSRPEDPAALALERYTAARTTLAQGRTQQAYDLLRDSPPPLAIDTTDYHAVLAAVEQQLGRYADATARYRQLLQLDERQAGWWLGLALALDGAGNRAEARAGFERALAFNTLPPAARDYAASRIRALENPSGR